jgi:hypothetical protein
VTFVKTGFRVAIRCAIVACVGSLAGVAGA